MTFDNNPRTVDMVFEQHGLRVIIDPQSLNYMMGAEIDYVDSLMGGGFHIENPNAVSSCGCGHSFRTNENSAAGGSGGCSSCH
jgi:iron-sulfur cluster assembly protein